MYGIGSNETSNAVKTKGRYVIWNLEGDFVNPRIIVHHPHKYMLYVSGTKFKLRDVGTIV
jgi:hypothetical protein